MARICIVIYHNNTRENIMIKLQNINIKCIFQNIWIKNSFFIILYNREKTAEDCSAFV